MGYIEKYPRGMEHAHQTDIAKSYARATGSFTFRPMKWFMKGPACQSRPVAKNYCIKRKSKDCCSTTYISGVITGITMIHMDGTERKSGLSGMIPEIHSWNQPSRSVVFPTLIS
jgi:hypothetical protein